MKTTKREKIGGSRVSRVRGCVGWVRQLLCGSWRFKARSHRNELRGVDGEHRVPFRSGHVRRLLRIVMSEVFLYAEDPRRGV